MKLDGIRFGIVGAGAISVSHANAIVRCPRARLYAVCDTDRTKAAKLAGDFGIPHVFADYERMLSLRDLDAVSICLPSSLHEAAVVAAANAGKHIFCEKPLDIALDKIDRMIEAAKRNRVKLGCAYQLRTMPEAIAVRQAVQRGLLGRMVLGDAYMKYYRSPEYYKSAGWRGTWKYDGGGALMNQGIHGIDLIRWLMGDIASVFAHTGNLTHRIETEDTAVVAVKYVNGAYGVIQGATSVYPGQSARFELHGDQGTIIFGDNGIQAWEVLTEEAELLGRTVKNRETDAGAIAREGHRILIEDLIDAVAADKEPCVNGPEARKAVAVIAAIYESSRTGKEVFL